MAAILSPCLLQARERSTQVQGSRGGTYERQVSRVPGSRASTTTATLANGKTATGQSTTQRTPTGRATSAQATGFNGRSATYESNLNRTDDGYTRRAEVNGPQGAATKDVTVTRQDGGVTRTTTTTRTPKP